MKTETKIKILLVPIIALSVIVGLGTGLDWKCHWLVICSILAISALVRYGLGLIEQTDRTTFIICDRDEYNMLDEDDLETRE